MDQNDRCNQVWWLLGLYSSSRFCWMQVELYAEFEPERLTGFLVSSQSYGLEAAHELCERKGLVREQVFVLGRMGNAREALDLIISKLCDVQQVCLELAM